MGGSYEAINESSDVTNLSSGMTEQIWNMLQNPTTYAQPFQTFLSQIEPGLTALTRDNRFAQSQFDLAQQKANEIRTSLGREWSGSIFSGPAQRAIGQGVATPHMQAVSNIAQQQNQLRGSLLGGGLSGLTGLYGQGLGGLTQLGMPAYWQPDYAYQPGAFDYIMGALGTGASIAGAAAGVPGLGSMDQTSQPAPISGGIFEGWDYGGFGGPGFGQSSPQMNPFWTFNR